MKIERSNTKLKVLVIILCVIVLALGGYFVYDKVLNDDNDVEINNNTNSKQEDKKINIIYDTLEEYQDTLNEYNYSTDVENKCVNLNDSIVVKIKDINFEYSYSCNDKTYSNIKIKDIAISEDEVPVLEVIKFYNYLSVVTSPIYHEIKFYDYTGKFINQIDFQDGKFGLDTFENDNIIIVINYVLDSYPSIPANCRIVDSLDEYCQEKSNNVSLKYNISIENNEIKYNELSKECSFVGL